MRRDSGPLALESVVLGTHTTIANGTVRLNAHTALTGWFLFGGNTYIVAAVNATGLAATHPALATGDVVVELSGLINVATSTHLHLI